MTLELIPNLHKAVHPVKSPWDTVDTPEPGTGLSGPQRSGGPPAPAVAEVELFGIRMASTSLHGLLTAVDQRIASGEPAYIVTPNVDHVVRYHDDPRFRKVYDEAWLRLPDGTPIMWVARWLGRPLRQKLSGSDLIYWLSEHAACRGYRVFLFGAADGVASATASILEARFPGLTVCGTYSPPMGFMDNPEEREKAIARLKETQPDICFVALGAPNQECWMREVLTACSIPIQIGIGASFDFVTGRRKRAPVRLQRMGLEWLWRLVHEPRRLGRRYLVDDLPFFPILWREWRRSRAES